MQPLQPPQPSTARPTRPLLTLVLLLLIVCLVAHLLYATRTPINSKSPTIPPSPVRIVQTIPRHNRALLMSCPMGGSHTHRGEWKPSSMISGVHAVLTQMRALNSSLPLYLGFYEREREQVAPACAHLRKEFGDRANPRPLHVYCFQIPEKYPVGLYGYAKIFAIRHVPVRQVLWLDCDVFPLRKLDPLFDDDEFKKTGAMFWPDSRDFFNEHKAQEVLKSAEVKKRFPVDAWWVRQGFDSGMVLLDTHACAQQIESTAQIARSPKNTRHLREMSMGDKDIFHIVWMMHNKNFTLVPYIGETGSIQTKLRAVNRHTLGSSTQNPLASSRLFWQMSSQVKHGRDGTIYALHQLHKQPRFSLVATLSTARAFFSRRVSRSSPHVKPYVLARLDLRLANIPPAFGASSVPDFVPRLEHALVGSARRIPRSDISLPEREIRDDRGLVVSWAPDWLHSVASEMSRAWKYNDGTDAVARAIYENHQKVLLQRRAEGGYKKEIYKRLWKERQNSRLAYATFKRSRDGRVKRPIRGGDYEKARRFLRLAGGHVAIE